MEEKRTDEHSTKMPDTGGLNRSSETAADATIVDSSLREVRQHGRPGFAMAVYEDNFSRFDQGYICWHWHEELQISVVKEKKIEFSVAGTSIVLEPGDAIFINSQALHQIRPCRPADGVIYSYLFQSAFLEHDGLSEIYRELIAPVLEKKELYLVMKREQTESTVLLERIRNVYREAAFGYQLQIKSMLCMLWQIIAGTVQAEPPVYPAKEERDVGRVKEAIRYIGEHYGEKILLTELADAVHVSKSELCRCFGRVMQTTPMDYLIQYRVSEAARLLSSTQEPVTQIAMMTGFDSAGHMGRFFRRQMGCSPREFRRQRRNSFGQNQPLPSRLPVASHAADGEKHTVNAEQDQINADQITQREDCGNRADQH